jgi:Rho guanine nucleotide exchange factor 10
LREDDVMQLEFNTNGLFSRSKPRRLILLNDLLVCVAVNGRSSEVDPSTSTSTSANERLTLKWAVPVSDVEVSQSDFLKVLELVSKELKHFWGDCRFIPTDWGS